MLNNYETISLKRYEYINTKTYSYSSYTIKEDVEPLNYPFEKLVEIITFKRIKN